MSEAATTESESSVTNDSANDPINQQLTVDDKIGMLRTMHRIRRFEQESLRQYQRGKMGGFLHLYIGQESVAVGSISLCSENDHIITAYRDHGHALAVGMGMNECMAELFGKSGGCSKGKGGSMHFFAPELNYWGGHGIVAGQTPLGAGLAFGLKYKGIQGAALCYMGDGAINQGAYHESLNLAELWDLPVIYIIENNGYSMGTSQERSSAHTDDGLAARAAGYGIEWEKANGEDIYEVRSATHRALERAHNECRPTVLELDTYRYYGHSVADANDKKYRTKEEIERYKQQHDPILLWHKQLTNEGVLDEATWETIKAEADEEVKACVAFAESSPAPEVSEIFDDVYQEVDEQTEAGKTGKHFFNS